MTLIFFDDNARETLLPLTFTRPVADLRIGILKISEKWQKYLKIENFGFKTEEYLQEKFPFKASEKYLFINGSVCPGAELLEAIDKLRVGEVLVQDSTVIAYKAGDAEIQIDNLQKVAFTHDILKVEFPEHIFQYSDVEIRKDFKLITHGRTSNSLSSTNRVLGENIFVEDGAEAECSVFNTLKGPIYLGNNSQVWENSAIRGSFALCDDALVKMGAKIYGATTIGPGCKVGGEIGNSVLQANSSKGHEGFLGNSVLGEWCNIGADSNNSNLKNNYAEVKLWDYTKQHFRKTGLQFCGLIMADHAKCGINTMFNTGTVVGVGANVFGSGYPRNYIPDFAWGGAHGFEVYALNKMFETSERVFERRNQMLNETEKNILHKVFELTEQYRRF